MGLRAQPPLVGDKLHRGSTTALMGGDSAAARAREALEFILSREETAAASSTDSRGRVT